ncbi:PH domain-containing protein [Dyella mobilis]|uniref:Bacterial Pleckstrin homology domain-containing protein n=1 Tax=Dyella mobilis TaxID=1849582 RepID=A0ABS2KIV4_9GAMM|nr:PH domain-containing protein [Dyella mobilis]MBM7131009.1 hypothetical protein [Dyella mobilis]
MTEQTTFQVSSSGLKPELMTIAMCTVLPVVITFIALLLATGHSNGKLLLGIFLATLPITAAMLYQVRSVSISLKSRQLTIGGGAYKVTVPVNTIDLNAITSDLPRGIMVLRANGIGMPGFRLGWFRSANGRKVFALSTGSDLLYLPTSGPYDVVLSTPQKAELVSQLRGE